MGIVRDGSGNPVRTSTGQFVTSGPSVPTKVPSTVPSANININGVKSAVASAVTQIPKAAASTVERTLSTRNPVFTQLFNAASNKTGFGPPPWPNELNDYASYAYKFTLSVLTAHELNNPDTTYRAGRYGKDTVILRNGGSRDKVTTFAEQLIGKPVELYIDDIQLQSYMTHNMGAKQAALAQIQFKVYEPYSMGQFIECLQVAALKAGYANYIEAPFLLKLEFVGWDDPTQNYESIPLNKAFATRFMPLHLAEIDFEVSTQGSVYNVVGYPYNHSVFTDVVQKITTDTNIKGRTVIEALQTGGESLATIINTALLKKAEAKKVQANQYVFLFPNFSSSRQANILGSGLNSTGATTTGNVKTISDKQKQQIYESITGIVGQKPPPDFDETLSKELGIVITRSNIGETLRAYAEKPENINPIGNSDFVKEINDSGNVPVAAPNLSQNKEKTGIARSKVQIPDKLRTFQYKVGMKMQDIIEDLILSSEWGRQVKERLKRPDQNNMVEWFKIDAHCYDNPDTATVAAKGESPKVYVFLITPFMVHASRFANPSAPQPSTAPLKSQAAKEYNYIYTGKNQDILDFQLKFDAAFYVALNAGAESMVGDKAATQQQMVNNTQKTPGTKPNPGAEGVSPRSGMAPVKDTTGASTGKQGGGGKQTVENAVARDVNDAIVNSPADLIAVDLKIWGDPFWISDDGMGNYVAGSTDYFNKNSDGSVNSKNGEVDLILNFSTPLDINPDFGYMDFPQGSGGGPVKAFSGLYQVIQCASRFSGGKFEQTLNLIRRRNQESDMPANLKGSPAPAVIDNEFGDGDFDLGDILNFDFE